jgi:hypothetical protein
MVATLKSLASALAKDMADTFESLLMDVGSISMSGAGAAVGGGVSVGATLDVVS